jgi:hypothetical protein
VGLVGIGPDLVVLPAIQIRPMAGAATTAAIGLPLRTSAMFTLYSPVP